MIDYEPVAGHLRYSLCTRDAKDNRQRNIQSHKIHAVILYCVCLCCEVTLLFQVKVKVKVCTY